MPELPEILSRAREMNAVLPGRQIAGVCVLQPKCLNIPVQDFQTALTDATIQQIHAHGKWIYMDTSNGWLLLNLGMGGEILWTKPDTLPEKRRLVFDFSDQTCLCINFWWFGYAHYVKTGDLKQHTMTAKLGPDALEITPDMLAQIVRNRRGQIKSILLNQENLAGIGNAYIHDILFLARLHPFRLAQSLNPDEINSLARAIEDGLKPALDKSGAFFEVDLTGQNGRFTMDDILIGYKEGKPCPSCGTAIQKIKTGATSSFICPVCQPLSNETA